MAFFVVPVEGTPYRPRKNPWKLLGKDGTPGYLLSLLIHGLVMLIPVSAILVDPVEELELHLLSEEKAVVQPPKVVEKKIERRVIEPPKTVVPPKEEVQEVLERKEEVKKEEVKKIEEEAKPEKVEPIIKESTSPLLELPPVQVSIPVHPPRETTPSEKVATPPPVDSSPRSEVREAVAFSKEASPTASIHEMEFNSREGPKFLRRVLPVYPIMARRLGKEGKVLLRLTIDEKGNLVRVEVVEHGGYGFTEAALEAVHKSTFLPAQKDGKPVASQALLPIRFHLRSD